MGRLSLIFPRIKYLKLFKGKEKSQLKNNNKKLKTKERHENRHLNAQLLKSRVTIIFNVFLFQNL